jgi:hypothetical protein
MKFHLINALATRVVSLKYWRVVVRIESPLDDFLRSKPRAQPMSPIFDPGSPFPPHSLSQNSVAGI